MAKGDELKGFLKAQQAKAEVRERTRAEEVAGRNAERREWKRAALASILALIPNEVKEYAKMNADFEPFMIVLTIPGCHPIWVTVEDTGGMAATVYPPLNPAIPVQATPAIPFRVQSADDLTDAIAAAVIDRLPAVGGGVK